MKLTPLTAFFIFSVLWGKSVAQSGFMQLRDIRKIEIPFEFKHNLMVVDVTFERFFALKFIFDTGAENTILAKRNLTDMMGVRYDREFKLLGSDLKTELTAYLVRDIHLQVADLVAPRQPMLVLKEDYFNFEELLGSRIDGILGADMFRGLTVKINYERQIITLTRAVDEKSLKDGYISLPIEVHRSKPYLTTFVRTQQDSLLRVKLLLDTGAMLSLLLDTETNPGLQPPPNALEGNIGAGLGGFLTGHLGRVASLSFGDLTCRGVLTNFQTAIPDTAAVVPLLFDRNGIIGNGVLSRFHVTIDYTNQRLLLLPNRHFKDDFEFDRSGLVVIATSANLNKFIVHSVISGSPADEAGLLPGDVIRRINRTPSGLLSLERIQQICRRKPGTKVKVTVKRGEERLKFQLLLKDLI